MTLKLGCKGCTANCNNLSYCSNWLKEIGEYGETAIRYTADGFDCALPVAIDTYNTCSYRCLYCFSNFLTRDPQRNCSTEYMHTADHKHKLSFQVKGMPVRRLERFLEIPDIPTPSGSRIQYQRWELSQRSG